MHIPIHNCVYKLRIFVQNEFYLVFALDRDAQFLTHFILWAITNNFLVLVSENIFHKVFKL